MNETRDHSGIIRAIFHVASGFSTFLVNACVTGSGQTQSVSAGAHNVCVSIRLMDGR